MYSDYTVQVQCKEEYKPRTKSIKRCKFESECLTFEYAHTTNALYTYTSKHANAYKTTKAHCDIYSTRTQPKKKIGSFLCSISLVGVRGGRVPWDNLFSTTKINPSRGGGEGGKKLVTAGSTYQRSQVKSVWCTFRFLLQQKRSVSVSDGLNEGLVSRATGSRSTRPGVCVYYQSPCVYSGLHPPPPPLSCLTRPPSLKHKRPHLQERAPTTPPPPRLPQNLSSITPQVLHTYTAVQRGAGTHPLWTHCTFLHCAGMWAHICNTQIRFMRSISKNVPQKKKSYTCVLTCMFRQKCMCTYTYMYPVHIHIGINFMQRPTFLVT